MRDPIFPVRLIVVVIFAAFVACAAPDDSVTFVPEDDPEMALAVSRARESLPHFWKVFETRDRGESGFGLKVRIEGQKNRVEHLWVTDLRREDSKIYGRIDNHPIAATSIKLGDQIEVPEGNITDWQYMRDGKKVGHFTVRALFRHMPDAQVERIKSTLADP